MRRFLAMVAVAVAFSIGFPVLLQAKDKKGANETVFNFEEDEVTVSFLKPEIGFVGVIEQEKIASLIKIRQDFVDEIVRSAEDL